MLKRVEIRQFRSCQDVVLDNLGPVVVLAGRNAVGKTNILKAIDWAARTATSVTDSRESRGKEYVSLQATVGQTNYYYTLETRADVDLDNLALSPDLHEELTSEDSNGAKSHVFNRQNEKVELVGMDSPIEIGASGPCMPALVAILPADSVAVTSIRPFLSFLKTIRYYSLEEHSPTDFSLAIPRTAYENWLNQYRSTGDPGDSVLLRLVHLAMSKQPQFEEIQSILGPNGLGLIDKIFMRAIEVNGTVETTLKPNDRKEFADRLYYLVFQPSLQSSIAPEISNSFGFGNLSAGTQRVIKIIVSMLFDQSSVMLLEHPEDSIHRGLLRKLIGVLESYSDQSQLIASSHSSVVFNALKPGSVRLVTMENGATKVRALTPEELSIAGRYLEEEGSLSDFLETVEED